MAAKQTPQAITCEDLQDALERFSEKLQAAIREDVKQELRLLGYPGNAGLEGTRWISKGAIKASPVPSPMRSPGDGQRMEVAKQLDNSSPRDEDFNQRPASSREMDYTLLPQQQLAEEAGGEFYSSERTPWNAPARLRKWAHSIVSSTAFEIAASVLVSLNCIEIGIEADFEMNRRPYPVGQVIQAGFCIVFCLELCMRMSAVGCSDYFCGEQWSWNWFDFVVVMLQLMDQIAHWCLAGIRDLQKHPSHHKTISGLQCLRMLRLARLFRIIRFIRVVHMIEDLQNIASSMMNAFTALLWTMMLLFIIVFIFSVLFMESITRARDGQNLRHHAQLRYYFGSLGRAMLTMFECIVGGVSWDEVVNPIISDVGPWMGVAFIIYIIITCYAVTNMMTGMFVQKAMQFAEDFRDRAQLETLKSLCFEPDLATGTCEDIDLSKFEEMANTPQMLDYFASLNVDASEAKILFSLLDADGGGQIDPAELVNGCLRLRGPAKSLDLCVLLKLAEKLSNRVDDIYARLPKDGLAEAQSDVAKRLSEKTIKTMLSEHSMKSSQKDGLDGLQPDLAKKVSEKSNKTDQKAWTSSAAGR